MITPESNNYRAIERLRDGRQIEIRALRPDGISAATGQGNGKTNNNDRSPPHDDLPMFFEVSLVLRGMVNW